MLPAVPDVHARLSQRGARVGHVACGGGWASIAIARAYPHARVDGYDIDEASIDLARANAVTAGVDGTVPVMDERTAEASTAPGDDSERFLYGFSLLCRLPAGMSETPSAATGTVMRPETLRRYARQAGFEDATVLGIEHDTFRFYRPA